ncbi:DUF4834 family protein [Roseivirga sp. BDSF3-8]|uniref:DUF4834 family protein n=1 Tax=Roseivirga sp. BDSF3-8 TaxID=3241598 RepID=UPI00353263F7
MFKFLIIFLIVIYAVYKLSGFFMRMLFSSLGNSARDNFGHYQQRANRQQKANEQKHTRPMGGNVNIDYIPEQEKRKGKPSGNGYKGGEYVDYEEIKD